MKANGVIGTSVSNIPENTHGGGGSITIWLGSSFTSVDSTPSLHEITAYFQFWSNQILLNWRPAVQWSYWSWRTLIAVDEQPKSSLEIMFLQLKSKTFIFMDWVAYWRASVVVHLLLLKGSMYWCILSSIWYKSSHWKGCETKN